VTLPSVGLCQCGCGERTTIADRTRPRYGAIKGQPRRFRPGHFSRANPKRGSANGHWRGGRVKMTIGYVLLKVPGHPHADDRGYHLEHRLVVERVLGKLLRPTAPVHHVNQVRSDNRNLNLVACQDAAYHQLLHRRQRASLACGDTNAMPCEICHRYDRQDDLRRSTTRAYRATHVTCEREARSRRKEIVA
jgi:hypothetical protein